MISRLSMRSSLAIVRIIVSTAAASSRSTFATRSRSWASVVATVFWLKYFFTASGSYVTASVKKKSP